MGCGDVKMIKASPYVIKNMSAILDQIVSLEEDIELEEHELAGELSEIRGTFEKFSLRYKNDDELQSICDEFENYLKRRDYELMDRIIKELEELAYIRRLESLVREIRHKGQPGNFINVT